jgi:predicted GNAT family acetyltransferase
MPPVIVPAIAVTVIDDAHRNRYELRVHGTLAAAANYECEPGRIVFTYTELMAGFEGQGLGLQLAAGALDDVRRRGETVIPRCPFMFTFIEDHHEYADLVGAEYEDALASA